MGKIICSAPARVDLSGGAADIFGLTTLSVAIDLRARCSIEDSEGGIVFDVGQGDVPAADATGSSYDILRNIVKRFGVSKDLAIRLSSDIPMSSGLGGSASIAVSAIMALNRHEGLGLSDFEVAEHAQRIETLGMGLKNGYQDQYTSTFGGCLYMDFRDKDNREVGLEPFATIEGLPFYESMVVANTGIKHNSGDVNSVIYDKYHSGDREVVRHIKSLDILTKNLRMALLEDDYEIICQVVNANQEIIRSFGRSCPESETLIKAALDNGAGAAKVTGAGCGGSIAAICRDKDDAQEVEKALAGLCGFVRTCNMDRGVLCEV